MIALLLAAALLTTADHAAGMGPTPPALGSPRFVQLSAIDGLPADSMQRAEFTAGFRGEMASDWLPAETRSAAGEWRPGAAVPNRFRLLEGSPAEDAWTLHVILGSPPPIRLPQKSTDERRRGLVTRRASRGMIAAFEFSAPSAAGGDAHPDSARTAFAFPPGGSGQDEVLGVPETGYLFPWNEAGRVVARLALEQLMRASRDLRAGERCSIAPAVRAEAGR